MCKSGKKRKVAILGSGCGGMSAAFWLSATPELRERYEVTVYTQGWRLGGKAASGRNAEHSERIEEHGLHMMMGFYNTVFYTMRACYQYMPMPDNAAFPDWQAAFEPQRSVTLWTNEPIGGSEKQWRPWILDCPRLAGLPGDELPDLRSNPSYMNHAVHHALERLCRETIPEALKQLESINFINFIVTDLLDKMAKELLKPAVNGLDLFIKKIRDEIIRLLKRWQKDFKDKIAPELLKQARDSKLIGYACYKCYLLMDLAFAGLIGFLSDILPHGIDGYARNNDVDLKDWLVANGADVDTAQSPPVMCLYDLAFAYPKGDSSDPAYGQAAAGAMVHLMIRMVLTYKDAPLWRMNAGMGDIIFTPFYTLLKKHGVRFEFFRRVTRLNRSKYCRKIKSIEMQRQAGLKKADYEPLKRLTFDSGKNWDCWPAEPDWTQLADGEKLKAEGVDFDNPWCHAHVGSQRLKRGKDFDEVVLAIPPAASGPITKALCVDNNWKAMLDNSTSVPTQSVQLWLKPTEAELGWEHSPTVATTYAGSLNSWATMDQILPSECWPAATAPKACQYLCGNYILPAPIPLPDSREAEYIPQQCRKVSDHAFAWVTANATPIWPAVSPAAGSFDWSQVEQSYNRANVAYSELYVLSLPGSIKYRLAPGKSGFDNLYLAGDWTLTSINGGCAEAAFESGMAAACAITGEPPTVPEF